MRAFFFWLLCVVIPVSWEAAGAGDVPPAAAIAGAHPLATEAGFEMLEAGGNAFDAAVAVTAVLAVVEPYSSGLGGGGFWLLHRAADGFQVMVDGRERAPLSASPDMYLDAGGAVTTASLDGPLSAGIPGVPAALSHLAGQYGRLPLARSLSPAIRLAREGFAVTPLYRRMASVRLAQLRRYPSSATVFLKDGDVPPLGYRIHQPDLARTFERLAQDGKAGFYAGRFADLLVSTVRAAGGIWTLADLASYQVREREPVRGEYGTARLVSAAPPSSGGVALVAMLNILGAYDVSALEPAMRVHLVAEAMRRAYHDRARYLGDPDFWPVPVARLVSRAHADRWRATIKPDAATPSASLSPVSVPAGAGGDTSHFSIVDGEGNRVAATLSINYPFGSGFLVPGTGVLLNDQMDDFSAKPGVPNAYGLVGAEANAIAGGKRPLSSMTPTFIETPGRVAVLGTPGGSRIISMVLLATLDLLDGGSADSMVSRPRFHHQYLPDKLFYEEAALDAETRSALQGLGHRLEPLDEYGNMQVVVWDRDANRLSAASDPRGEGAADVR
jgi:gamma-glutamyltranspeptidase/glutathione hydrolase